jgi:glycosyltransferase involved in cell wall biosynthesis
VALPTVVHITADFGDALVPGKTRAVPQLLAGATDFRNVVYSLNRVTRWGGCAALEFERDRIAIAYGAPPKGLFLETFLKPVAELIISDIRARNLKVDLVHAHKLTIDGIVGLAVAKALGAPLAVSVWGDTDQRVMQFRSDLKSTWQEILDHASAILPLTPWLYEKLEANFAFDRSKATLIPAITRTDRLSPSKPVGPRLVSLFHLDSHRRKGADLMIRAVETLMRDIPDISLDIYGGGSPKAFLELTDMIAASPAKQKIVLKGPTPNDRVHDLLQSYGAFILPSRRESYGMVYVEALFAGLPILFTKGWGVDRLFDNDLVGVACKPSSAEEVTAGVAKLIGEEARFKAGIAEAQQAGAFDHVRREVIHAAYTATLSRLTGRSMALGQDLGTSVA